MTKNQIEMYGARKGLTEIMSATYQRDSTKKLSRYLNLHVFETAALLVLLASCSGRNATPSCEQIQSGNATVCHFVKEGESVTLQRTDTEFETTIYYGDTSQKDLSAFDVTTNGTPPPGYGNKHSFYGIKHYDSLGSFDIVFNTDQWTIEEQ